MFEVMMTLFAIMIVGYVAGRLGYLGGEFDKKLSSLVINFTCPALILSSAMTGELPDRQLILPLLGISLLTYIIVSGVALWLPHFLTRKKEDEGVVGFALMFGNVGFMGYPVVASIFDHQAVFYAAVLNVVNTFAVFTIGTILINGDLGEGKHFQKKVLYSTPMLSAYMAMLIVAFGIDSQPLTMIGNITVPAALLIIGSSMSQLSARTMLGDLTVYATTIFRLLLIPVGFYFFCKAVGFNSYVVNINTVVIAMPVATYGTILCLKYNRDTTLITEVTLITTLLSMITIPLLTILLGL